jgi:glycerol-3-phosphate dehydrogenase (NAD(P)+)
MKKIAVIGGGSWATALVKILSENVQEITWWMRDKNNIEHIERFGHNAKYLSSIVFDLKKVKLTDDLKNALRSAEVIILAVPAAFVHETLSILKIGDFQGKTVFSAVKGIVPQTSQILGEYLNTQFQIPLLNIGVITGPCHAEEVALEKLSYLTIAGISSQYRAEMAKILTCRFINTVESDDIYGTEYSAVLKNIFAIATGITIGMGLGDNFRAVLIANAIQEIKRFVDAVHPINRDINASAYLGDLLVTCYSPFSRNRTFGVMIGKGYSVKSAQIEMNMIAEGYYAADCVKKINDENRIHLPISQMVYQILYKNKSVKQEMDKLSLQLN